MTASDNAMNWNLTPSQRRAKQAEEHAAKEQAVPSEALSMSSLEARHKAVREFVEARYPGRTVKEIRESGETVYQPFPPNGEMSIVRITSEFTVEAVPKITSVEPVVQCRVVPLEDGTLRIAREEFFHSY